MTNNTIHFLHFCAIRSDLKPHLNFFLFHFCMDMESWTLRFIDGSAEIELKNNTVLGTEGTKLN